MIWTQYQGQEIVAEWKVWRGFLQNYVEYEHIF